MTPSFSMKTLFYPAKIVLITELQVASATYSCHQIATAPANAIKATVDMSAKSTASSAVVTEVVQKEALPLVRARSTSISDDNEEVVGMSLIVDPPTQQRKNLLMSL